MSDYPKTDPRNVNDAIGVADSKIDKQAGPAGVQVKASRTLLRQMNDAASAAIEKQQSGGSGTP